MNTRRNWNRMPMAMLLAALLALMTVAGMAAQDESPPAPAGEVAPEAAAPAAMDNTTPGTATTLACGQGDNTPYLSIYDSAPRWFKFTANAGWTLAAGIVSAEQGWLLDSKLTLLKSNATTVVAANDNGDGLDPLVHVNIPETGTYYLKVERVSGEGVAFLWLDLPIYVSMAGGGTVDGISYGSNDVLRYLKCSDRWEMHLNMENLGINGNVAGLGMIANPGSFFVSFSKATTINGQQVKPQDISLLNITDFGWDTAGVVAPATIKGVNIGLTKASEAIDSIALVKNPNGGSALLLSIAGNGAVPGVSGIADEDLLRLTLPSTWAMYFDGSDVGLAGVDIWGVWWNPTVNELFLSFDKPISSSGANAAQSDIVVCNLGTTGQNTSCNEWYNPPSFGFDASAAGLTGKVDAIEITGGPN